MSAVENVVDEDVKDAVTEAPQRSALEDLLKERDIKPSQKNENKKPAEEVKKEVIQPKENKEVEKSDTKKEEDVKKSEKSSTVDDEEGVDSKHQKELEKLQKALNDSKKWGHSNNKRLKKVLGVVNVLKDEEVLTEDQFNYLNSLLNSDSSEEEEFSQISNDPVSNLIDVAKKRLDDLREIYDTDENFNKKIQAFDMLIESSSEIERDEILEELEEFKNSPLKLVKKMYQMGEEYYNDVYNSIDKAGGLRAFIKQKNSEIDKMKKKIDILEKKSLESDKYDPPKFKIDELTDTGEVTTQYKPGSVLDGVLRERDRPRR